jgi:hypothetical protein
LSNTFSEIGGVRGKVGGLAPLNTAAETALKELVEAEKRRADASERRTDQLHGLIDRLALAAPEHLRTAPPIVQGRPREFAEDGTGKG